jgi:hypothetical protein
VPEEKTQPESEQAPPPRVFISYSHDSPQHKEWVEGLAGRLRGMYINVILDQWEVSFGTDLASFMEQGLTTADRVLVVCTPTYCKKANDGNGGVGYEKIIVTQDLIRNTQTDKFVPVVRIADGDPRDVIPKCLGGRLFIDFRDGQEENKPFEALIRDLHRQPPVTRPPLGKHPFAQTATGAPVTAGPVPTAPPLLVAINLDPVAVYNQAVQMARARDLLGWRHLARDVRGESLSALVSRRSELNQLMRPGAMSQETDICKLLDVGMAAVAPMFAMALAGIESGLPDIERQNAVLGAVINVDGWNEAGYGRVIDLPLNLGFMYHYFHGAMAMQVGRLDLAMELARSNIRPPNHPEQTRVCDHSGLTGWTPAFQTNVTHSWRYLRSYVKQNVWIQDCFGSYQDVMAAIAGYGYALTLDELANDMQRTLKRDRTWIPHVDSFAKILPKIPLFFAVVDDPAPERGYQLFLRSRRDVPGIWQHYHVPDKLMPIAWEAWVRGSAAWLSQRNDLMFPFDRASRLPHASLMSDLGSGSAHAAAV